MKRASDKELRDRADRIIAAIEKQMEMTPPQVRPAFRDMVAKILDGYLAAANAAVLDGTISGAIHTLRGNLGDTQEAFAKRMNISRRAVANYEKARTPEVSILNSLTLLARARGLRGVAGVFQNAIADRLTGHFGSAALTASTPKRRTKPKKV